MIFKFSRWVRWGRRIMISRDRSETNPPKKRFWTKDKISDLDKNSKIFEFHFYFLQNRLILVTNQFSCDYRFPHLSVLLVCFCLALPLILNSSPEKNVYAKISGKEFSPKKFRKKEIITKTLKINFKSYFKNFFL